MHEREHLDLQDDVEAPPGPEIRHVEVLHGGVDGALVVLPHGGMDLGDSVHGAVPELTHVGLDCSGRPWGSEEAIAISVDLSAMVEAEDHRRRFRRRVMDDAWRGELPCNTPLLDDLTIAACSKKRRYMFSPEVGSNFSGMQARLFLGGV